VNLPIQRILGKDGLKGFPACLGEISRPLEQIARAEQGQHALCRLNKNIRSAIAVRHQVTWWGWASSIVQSCSNSFYDEDRPTVSRRLRACAVEDLSIFVKNGCFTAR
jgi:hypothetical protein